MRVWDESSGVEKTRVLLVVHVFEESFCSLVMRDEAEERAVHSCPSGGVPHVCPQRALDVCQQPLA